LDEIFTLAIPNPDYIIDRKFYDKVKIFEALNLSPSGDYIKKLLAINNLRNKYAHNLKYKLTKKDLQNLINRRPVGKGNNITVTSGFTDVIAYMHALIVLLKIVPFTYISKSYNKIFLKQKGYEFNKIYKFIYPNNEMRDVLDLLNK